MSYLGEPSCLQRIRPDIINLIYRKIGGAASERCRSYRPTGTDVPGT